MAILAPLFAFIGRYVGKLLNMAFGWASTLLFGRVPQSKQLWANSDEIRNTIIQWVKAKGTVDPAQFASVDWRLTRAGVPVF